MINKSIFKSVSDKIKWDEEKDKNKKITINTKYI